MSYRIKLEAPIAPNSKLLFPISLFQKYHSGLFLKAFLDFSQQFNSTFLLADALQQYNLNNNLEKALQYGSKFLKKNTFLTNSAILINNIDEWFLFKEKKIVKIIHWNIWKKIKAAEFAKAMGLIIDKLQNERSFSNAMKEVTETFRHKCQADEGSINYQIEECAFLLTFQEFDYHIYPTCFNRSQEATYESFKNILKIPIPLVPDIKEIKQSEMADSIFNIDV